MTSTTDNQTTELTATERLRALLDEHGVKYETADGWWTSWDTAGASDVGAVVYCEDLGSGLEIRWNTITPEQAIAATLGSGTCPFARPTDLTDGCAALERITELEATHGTLTAEQVEKAIHDCSTYASYDGCTYYASGIRLQAIADELNARAERTCELKWTLQGETQTQEFWRCECGNCGECFGVEDRSSFPFKVTIDKVDIPNYCPNCGAKVRNE